MNSRPAVNPFQIKDDVVEQIASFAQTMLSKQQLSRIDPSAMILQNVLSEQELSLLNQAIEAEKWLPVGQNGILEDYQQEDRIGSYRASCFNQKLAALLFRRIKSFIPLQRIMDDTTATDWQPWSQWQAIGVNPLLRFINYKRGGLLIPHYDAPYDNPNNEERTLMTMVLYLRCDPQLQGGETRFIRDPQAQVPVVKRDLADWSRPADKDEIILSVKPEPGTALLFDHRVLHDSAPINGQGEKTILRTDINYQPRR